MVSLILLCNLQVTAKTNVVVRPQCDLCVVSYVCLAFLYKVIVFMAIVLIDKGVIT